jgi:hypothetical protein
MGDFAAARACFEEGLALFRAAGELHSSACALMEVGHAAWLQGDHGVTRANALEALTVFHELGDKGGLLIVLESLGVAALAAGRNAHAAVLLGAAESLREALELPATPWWRIPRERISAAIRASSLQQVCVASWQAGQALSLDEAVGLALHEAGET